VKIREYVVFHSLATLSGFPLATADGEKRPIRNFLFDDRSWLVRYLIVDAGTWLAPRQVVLSTAAVNTPNWKKKVVPTELTLEQVLNSPPAETVRPVSRQQELAWSRHFGWPDQDSYWRGPSMAAQREFEGSGNDDPHLRRTADLKGYELLRSDGSLGKLEGYFIEDRSWHIGYLLMRQGEWVYREQLVSTQYVCGISWAEHRVLLDCPAERPCDPPGGPQLDAV
jgi:hypothetical protein